MKTCEFGAPVTLRSQNGLGFFCRAPEYFSSVKCPFSVILLLKLDHVRPYDVDPLCFPSNRSSNRSPTALFLHENDSGEKMINNSVCSKSYRSMTDEERELRELQQQLWIYFGLDGDRPF